MSAVCCLASTVSQKRKLLEVTNVHKLTTFCKSRKVIFINILVEKCKQRTIFPLRQVTGSPSSLKLTVKVSSLALLILQALPPTIVPSDRGLLRRPTLSFHRQMYFKACKRHEDAHRTVQNKGA